MSEDGGQPVSPRPYPSRVPVSRCPRVYVGPEKSLWAGKGGRGCGKKGLIYYEYSEEERWKGFGRFH